MPTHHGPRHIASLVGHRVGSWLGERAARAVGRDPLAALLRRLEERLPEGSFARSRFHAVCSMTGDLDAAADLLERRALERLERPSQAIVQRRPQRGTQRPLRHEDARAALALVLARLRAAGVTPFLTFGTLLGAVREGAFLAHDADIDLGVFSDEGPPERLRLLFRWGSGLRLALPSLLDSRALPVKLRHSSGAAIDLIPFERRSDAFITRMTFQGHFLERRRRPFGLRWIDFEGSRVCIPDPPEAFLDENYGDWRVPRTSYHCVLSSRMPFDPRDPLVRYFLYGALDDALARGAWEQARWLAGEALQHGMQGPLLLLLATPPEASACASTPR